MFIFLVVLKWHVNLSELFNAKIFVDEQQWYKLVVGWERDKRVHAFP